MKRNKLLSLIIAIVMVLALVSSIFAINISAAELPANGLTITHIGYVHDSFVCLVAGDGETVGQLTERGCGAEKDMNYFYLIVVDANGFVCGYYNLLGRDEVDGLSGVKTDIICPKGGYMIAYNGGYTGATIDIPALNIALGDIVTLYNVDPQDARDQETGNYEVEEAGFTVSKPVAAEGYTRINPITGTLQAGSYKTQAGASYDYRIFTANDRIYFDFIVYGSLDFKEVTTDQTGASNFRIWLDTNNNDSRGLLDIFYNGSTFVSHRIDNDSNGTIKEEDIDIRMTKSNGSFNVIVGIPFSALDLNDEGTFAYSTTYSSPYLFNGISYGAIHESVYTDATDAPWAASGFNYTVVSIDEIPEGEVEDVEEPVSSTTPSESSKTTTDTGDTGYIAIAVIAVISLAGAFIAKRSR